MKRKNKIYEKKFSKNHTWVNRLNKKISKFILLYQVMLNVVHCTSEQYFTNIYKEENDEKNMNSFLAT